MSELPNDFPPTLFHYVICVLRAQVLPQVPPQPHALLLHQVCFPRQSIGCKYLVKLVVKNISKVCSFHTLKSAHVPTVALGRVYCFLG